MIKSRRQHQIDEDRARELTPSKVLIRTVFFGTLLALLLWGPWELLTRVLICTGGVLVFVALMYSTSLKRHV